MIHLQSPGLLQFVDRNEGIEIHEVAQRVKEHAFARTSVIKVLSTD